MYHIRTLSSTNMHPQTACGAEPEYYSHISKYGEEMNQLISDPAKRYKAWSILKMTDWQFVKSMPTMAGVCQDCVNKITVGGAAKVVINKEKPVYESDPLDAPPF